MIERAELIIGASNLRISTGTFFIKLHLVFNSKNIVKNTLSTQMSNK